MPEFFDADGAVLLPHPDARMDEIDAVRIGEARLQHLLGQLRQRQLKPLRLDRRDDQAEQQP